MIGIVLSVLTTLGLLLGAVRLNARARTLPVLRESRAIGGGYRVVVADGVELSPDVAARAAAHGLAYGVGLLDLVPARQRWDAVHDLLAGVDPRRYRADRLGTGRTAGAALLVASDAVARFGPLPTGVVRGPDVAALAAAIRPYVQVDADLVVVPGLTDARSTLNDRRALLTEGGVVMPLRLAASMVAWLAVAASLGFGGWWGLAALVLYCAQPALAVVGSPLRPIGLLTATVLRPVTEPYVWWQTLRGPLRPARVEETERLRTEPRAWYEHALVGGTARFRGPRRTDCPACGSTNLTLEVRSPDLVQDKPGMFTLERCQDCRHVFQNPALTDEGLGFHYRDFYDGYSAATIGFAFGANADSYRGRARMVEPFGAPKHWLDVGTGHGHFCNYAQDYFPDTVFSGLDQGSSVEDAERRGWISTGFRGEFVDVAPRIANHHDVISMHHYLEHTRDPWREIATAAEVLPPRGLLLIELPDPDWWLRRLLRRYWVGWLQPQHLHVMPIENLQEALVAAGLTPVAAERGAAHQACDLTIAVLYLSTRFAPDPHAPWRTTPVLLPRLRNALAWTVGMPFLVSAVVLDNVIAAICRRGRPGRGNAYRVLARKEEQHSV